MQSAVVSEDNATSDVSRPCACTSAQERVMTPSKTYLNAAAGDLKPPGREGSYAVQLGVSLTSWGSLAEVDLCVDGNNQRMMENHISWSSAPTPHKGCGWMVSMRRTYLNTAPEDLNPSGFRGSYLVQPGVSSTSSGNLGLADLSTEWGYEADASNFRQCENPSIVHLV